MAGERVLLLNTSVDIIEAVTDLLEQHEYAPTARYVRDLRLGEIDGEELLDSVRPRAVIFDVAPPVDANWEYFIRFRPLCDAREIPTLLTTTVPTMIQERAGREVVELLLKPFDLKLLLELLAVATGRERNDTLARLWLRQISH